MIRKQAEMKNEVRENMRGGEGSVTIQHMFGKDEFGGKVRLCARLVLPPGAGIGPHSHEEEDEVYYIEKGEGVLDDGSSKTKVVTGDAVLTGKGGTHAISNTGAEPLEIVAFIAQY